MKSFSVPVLLLLVLPLAFSPGQRADSPASKSTATANVVAAAKTFLATLSEEERTNTLFDFAGVQRTGWSNLPSGIFQRKGLRLGDLAVAKRDAALALMAAALSKSGYEKVLNIMNADEVLKNARGGQTGGRQGAAGRGGAIRFGADEYFIALLGTPSATAPWLIQFGGHHLAINVTVVGPSSAMTPSLPATQPARYVLNGRRFARSATKTIKGSP